MVIGTYVYLDWGFLKILGATFVMAFAHEVDERGPRWRKALWATIALALMVAVHFFVDDYVIYWLELAGSALLFIIAISLVKGLVNPERGAGSVLTFYFLGAVICVPLAILFLYKGLSGLGYW